MSSERLAVAGGTPVHTRPWPTWPPASEELWETRIGPRLKEVFLSRTEGIPHPQALAFCEAWKQYAGVEHAFLCSHGTDALQAAVAGALDIDALGYGGEVICPNYTFIASAGAPLSVQCGVCLVDVDYDSHNLDPAAVEAAITPRTVALLAVHLGGHPADMAALNALAAKHGLKVIEDCAQAHGAKHYDTQVGALGDVAGFSYQSSKNLTSGEGGLVTTNDLDTHDRAYAYVNIGRSLGGARWEHPRIGWNYRLGEYQAALLLARLETLDAETNLRDANGLYLNSLLAQIPGITPPRRQAWCGRHAYHLYMAKYDPAAFGGRPRTEFLAALNAEGVPCSVGYDRLLSDQDGLKLVAAKYPERYRAEPCPNAEGILATSWWLVQNILLGTRQDMDDIATAVAKIQRAWAG